MLQKLKNWLYFYIAWYFRFFAQIKLKIWNPRIAVIMGSSGKTTLLHLIESQLKEGFKYSHHANSSLGIPFDILGLKRKDLLWYEWIKLFIQAPIKLFSKTPVEKIYIVEADCDRPYEGDFLSSLLKPEITLWTTVSKTHSMNFDSLVNNGEFSSIEKAIAYEFGFFVERTTSLVLLNADNNFEVEESSRVQCNLEKISLISNLNKYEVETNKTKFHFKDFSVNFNCLLPKEVGLSILMCKRLVEYFGYKFDNNFTKFKLPPGRSSTFKGIKNTTIVDSAYNSNLSSLSTILEMFNEIKTQNPKWIVIGDMLEQGNSERSEHVKLANKIKGYRFDKVVLLGPRVREHAKPILGKDTPSFLYPKEVLNYLKMNIKGGEIILFKGARFLEGVIENLLLNKKDSAKLDRREKAWQIRRKKWGL